MPIIHPTMCGFVGSAHAKDFAVADKYVAYVEGAKLMAMTAIDLLYGGAENALSIKAEFSQPMTKEEYLNF
jgi:hypothetical protein